jgi:putative lipase involved disintegration of autophagic bodies
MGGLYGTDTLIRLSLSNINEYKQNNRTQNSLVWRPKALTNQTTNERRIRLSADWQNATENVNKTNEHRIRWSGDRRRKQIKRRTNEE